MYVSSSPTTVGDLVNQLNPVPKLTPKDVASTYLHLHDTEHATWVRVKDMNKAEKDLLRNILQNCGVHEKLWRVDVIQPMRGLAGLRLVSPSLLKFNIEDEDGET